MLGVVGSCASEDYELVRVHHPDAPYGRDLSPAIRRSRFQAITAAYDTLRGKRGSGADGPVDIYREEILRRKRAWAAHEEARRRSGHPWEDQQGQKWKASADDRWKDRIILIIGIMALGAGLGPVFVLPSYSASRQAHLSASRNLAQARSEAQEFGEEQRREISKRVKAFKEQQAQERSAGKGSSSVSSAS
uniref:Polygalacturonase (PG) ) n=1 Tax=Ganoderma boninense TaxID=34458 RepID=A0A5K1K702_9APHY|nr:Polygalacturonase (PG) (EC (Pectinase) [Ganoderma boninense]